MDWENLPDPIFIQCIYDLKISDIASITQVCRNWNRLCQDEFLWKHYFIRDFKLSRNINLPNGRQDSWKVEYKRLMDEVPLVECQDIDEHSNQVLHAAFSNNGTMFATASKDSTIVVWSVNHPCEALYHRNMQYYSWKYTQFSQFNSTDELLLVSGVHYGEGSTSGEIVILRIEDNLPLQCRSVNRPYDLFGTWYNSQYFLSGEFHWFGQMRSANMLWLNRASQEAHSEHVAVILRFCQFFNSNATSIRSLMVCDAPETLPPKLATSKPLVFNTASTKMDTDPEQTESLPEANEAAKSCDDRSANVQREVEAQLKTEPDKLLIFTTGSRACTPHEIGIKEIRQYQIDTQVHVDTELRTRVMRRRAEIELKRQGVITERNEINLETIEANFDAIDHVIDLNGQIIGMALSPDSRYLYVNCRAWPADAKITEPLEPPQIAEEIDIHVIDLTTITRVGTLLRAHKAYTPKRSCYFIFLDVSHKYVTSGAEDCKAYIWDRYHEICIARLPHTQVVNCAAFNPVCPEMLVSVGDDNKIKVWRSRNQVRHLQIDATNLVNGEERRKKLFN